MGIINKLSKEVSNQIAAGEVIERPASVVKELVENAIDAGATQITVIIERGGINHIQVTDNGFGMSREDALLCFERHATSKISKIEDINNIMFMGFRGEALASISSIAHVDLFTKREQDTMGTHILCIDSQIQSCEDEGMPNGTTFIVSDIFYNVPARMKFLKRDATEASYITDIMTRLILSHPEISFRYLNGKKEIFHSVGDNKIENCVYAVYGKDYANSVIPVNYTQGHIKISGVIGKAETSRPNRVYQNIFVNKRYIKSIGISRKVEEAYKNQIMIGKYPMFVLNIEVDASVVDVNVHPTKQEVRFSSENEGEILTAVYRAVENGLYETKSIPKMEIFKKPVKTTNFVADIVTKEDQYPIKWRSEKSDWTPAEEVDRRIREEKEEKKKKELSLNDEDRIKSSYMEDRSKEYFKERVRSIIREDVFEGGTGLVPLKEKIPETTGFKMPESKTPFRDAYLKMEAQKKEEAIVKSDNEDAKIIPDFKVVGQIFLTYVIVEKDNEMLFIDQHAAHERIKYEELKKELEEKKMSAQDLLIPVTCKISPTEKIVFEENQEFFNELGFEAESFGEDTVIIRTAPSYVDYEDVCELLIELIDNIQGDKEKNILKKAEYAVYTIACKAAIKANHRLDEKELEALVEKVFELDKINTCPHGRPITISMTKKELEKEFKRIL